MEKKRFEITTLNAWCGVFGFLFSVYAFAYQISHDHQSTASSPTNQSVPHDNSKSASRRPHNPSVSHVKPRMVTVSHVSPTLPQTKLAAIAEPGFFDRIIHGSILYVVFVAGLLVLVPAAFFGSIAWCSNSLRQKRTKKSQNASGISGGNENEKTDKPYQSVLPPYPPPGSIMYKQWQARNREFALWLDQRKTPSLKPASKKKRVKTALAGMMTTFFAILLGFALLRFQDQGYAIASTLLGIGIIPILTVIPLGLYIFSMAFDKDLHEG